MNLPGGSGSSGEICFPAICSSPVSTRPGKNPSPEGAGESGVSKGHLFCVAEAFRF
jgi:hypothetical protein